MPMIRKGAAAIGAAAGAITVRALVAVETDDRVFGPVCIVLVPAIVFAACLVYGGRP